MRVFGWRRFDKLCPQSPKSPKSQLKNTERDDLEKYYILLNLLKEYTGAAYYCPVKIWLASLRGTSLPRMRPGAVEG
jgi:hypothetical protein